MKTTAVSNFPILGLRSNSVQFFGTWPVTGTHAVAQKELGSFSQLPLTLIPDHVIPHRILREVRLAGEKQFPLEIMRDSLRELTQKSKILIEGSDDSIERPTSWVLFLKSAWQCLNFAAANQKGPLGRERGIEAGLSFRPRQGYPQHVFLSFNLNFLNKNTLSDYVRFLVDLNLEVVDGR